LAAHIAGTALYTPPGERGGCVGTVLFIVAVVFVFFVVVGTFKSIFSLQFPQFVKPLEAGTRDAYLILGALAAACFVLALWKTGKLTSFEIAGIRGEVQRIDQRVTSLAEQIEDLYKAKKREMFDASNWQQVRVIRALPKHQGFELEVTLREAPIPNSVEVFRGPLTIPLTTLLRLREKSSNF
jgi:uncharacterized protein (UPF0335 family)